MIGLNKCKDVLPVYAQFRRGDKCLRQTVDARQAPVGLVGECRQLLVKTPRKVQLNVTGVALDDLLIIEDPLGGRRRTLFQSTRFGEIRAYLMDPLMGVFDPP